MVQVLFSIEWNSYLFLNSDTVNLVSQTRAGGGGVGGGQGLKTLFCLFLFCGGALFC